VCCRNGLLVRSAVVRLLVQSKLDGLGNRLAVNCLGCEWRAANRANYEKNDLFTFLFVDTPTVRRVSSDTLTPSDDGWPSSAY
jgi:hypothetical protein